MNQYFSAEELLYDIENEFNHTKSYFPPEARDLVRERFQYRRIYAEMQQKEDEQRKISELLGSGHIPKSTTDEIIDNLRRPEILDINIEDLVTTKETVIPPEIKRFATRNTFFGRIASGFRRLFQR